MCIDKMCIRGYAEHDDENMMMIFDCVVNMSNVVDECKLRESLDLDLRCQYDQIHVQISKFQ